MPRGAGSFTRHQAAVEQRRDQAMESMGPIADYFGLKSGEIAVVRFLEQGEDLAYASIHKVKVANRNYPIDVICLDQDDAGTPCPFCLSEYKEVRSRRTVGFLNLIWRGSEAWQQLNAQTIAQNSQRVAQGLPPYMTYSLAPVYKRSQNGVPEKDEQTKQKIVVGYSDSVFMWKCSNAVFQELLNKDRTYRGLMSCDFTIRRQGSGMQDTTYFIEPYDVNNLEVPLTPTDQALIAAIPWKLDAFITPMSYEDAVKMLSGNSAAVPGAQFQRGAGVVQPMPGVENPFSGGVAPMPASQPPVAPPPVS